MGGVPSGERCTSMLSASEVEDIRRMSVGAPGGTVCVCVYVCLFVCVCVWGGGGGGGGIVTVPGVLLKITTVVIVATGESLVFWC